MKEASTLFKRIETDIENYLSSKIEISPGVFFSQRKVIERIYKFKNRDLSGSKINEDLSYNYYFDIISPRADGETKNLRFDTKNILIFSQNPRTDFSAVFISNACIKAWMRDNGEDDKLKAAVEEFTANGNIGFKKVKGGYEIVDALNTYVTNQKAETIDDTDLIERHEVTASQMMAMKAWDSHEVEEIIEDTGLKSFTASDDTTPIESTNKRYELFEFTGEVSEKEFNMLKDLPEGDENTYFLAKVVVAGLNKSGTGKKYVPFAEKLTGKMSDHYIYAHRGKYEGRFWRVGMYELLFDHQIRANEIGNQLAVGLDWASKVIFKSKDSRVLQNIRADMDNGDVVITEDLSQVDVRLHGLDQLIDDWNRLMQDANSLSHASEVVTGESLPSGTPFRLGALLDQNAGKMFVLLRQKITLPYKRVFRNWVLSELLKDLSGEDIINLTGEVDMLDQLREIIVNDWYVKNLVAIGPHTAEMAKALKEAKMEELKDVDPTIKNNKEIWKNVSDRLFVTITGENSDLADNIQDIVNLLSLEQDPARIAFLLDSIYKIRGIPVPPPTPPETAQSLMAQAPPQKEATQNAR
jgi:hypothetical protein